jgi:predicted kinase
MKNPQITLVLMAGLPGAGKTTLAYALRDLFQWHVVDKDKYRVEGLEQGLDQDVASSAAYDISFTEITTLIKQEVSVIFDTAALDSFILARVQEIVDSVQGARLKIILCVVDRDLRNRRLRARKELYPTRIRVDPATIADYLHQFRHLPEDRLTLYTSASLDGCLTNAIDYLIKER